MAYRIAFVLGGLYIVGIIIYVLMAASIPVATAEQLRELEAAEESDGLLDLNQPSNLDRLEAKLAKIESMKTQKLITPEEAEKLRAKWEFHRTAAPH